MAKLKEVKKRDLYKEVTTNVVAALKGGEMPWESMASMPYNATTGVAYAGVNTISLALAQSRNGYEKAGWLTYKQAEALGAQVRKGEHGVLCVKYAIIEKKKMESGLETVERIPYLSAFTVFNVAQVDNLPESLVGPTVPEDGVAALEELLALQDAAVMPTLDVMQYDPVSDKLFMPPDEVFESELDRVSTKAHGYIAWTAHKDRCNRGVLRDELKALAYDELVNELGAAFLCAAHGIRNSKHSAEHVSAWIELLEADSRILFKVAKQAKAGADWLLKAKEVISTPEELKAAA